MAILTTPSPDPVQALFLDQFPRFCDHARFAFRHVHCPATRDDRVAESLALAWRHFVALLARGKNPAGFVTVLALRCSQAVKAGRRLTGTESPLDVLSPLAATRHQFSLIRDQDTLLATGPWAEAVTENGRTPVPDQAAFRIDFPRWRSAFAGRDRAILDALMAGSGTLEVARAFRVTPGRVSQLRRMFEASWRAFHASRTPG